LIIALIRAIAGHKALNPNFPFGGPNPQQLLETAGPFCERARG
jgi:hypothetical protein